jgi:hypothetical protein
MKISLTKGKYTVIDDDMRHISKHNWYFKSTGYAVRKFYIDKGKRGTMYLHHAVVGQPLNKMEIDHINGNRLDNRRKNLRIVTHRENTWNQTIHRNGKKSIGASLDKRGDLIYWAAQIEINRKCVKIGYFKTEKEASLAYQKKLKEILL